MVAVVCLNEICLHRHWDEPAGVCDACTYNSCMHVYFFLQEVTYHTLINTSSHSPLKNRVRPTNFEIDQVTTDVSLSTATLPTTSIVPLNLRINWEKWEHPCQVRVKFWNKSRKIGAPVSSRGLKPVKPEWAGSTVKNPTSWSIVWPSYNNTMNNRSTVSNFSMYVTGLFAFWQAYFAAFHGPGETKVWRHIPSERLHEIAGPYR
jgi:hypothetical protein